MIQNLIFKIIFLKKIFGHTISSTHFSEYHQSFCFNFRFLAESLKASKNYRKRCFILQYSFVQKISLIIWTSTHLTLKIICCCNTAKNLSEFTKKFPANMFLFCVRKKHLHSTVFWRPKLYSWSTFKANVRLFPFISVRKDIVRFYLIRGGFEGSWIISLRRLVFWAS